MNDQPAWFRATIVPLIAVLLIAGVFSAAFFLYPVYREPLLVDRDYRVLASLAAQIANRINDQRTVAERQPGQVPPNQDIPAREVICGTPGVQPYLDNHAGELALYLVACENSQPAARTRSKPKAASTASHDRLDSGFVPFVNEVLGQYGYFDTVLLVAKRRGEVLYQRDIAAIDGRVIYSSDISTGRIASLQDLESAEQPNAAEVPGGQTNAQANAPQFHVMTLIKLKKALYLGQDYQLFAQPVSSGVFVVERNSVDSGHQAALPEQSELLLIGLVNARRLAAEARQLPWSWLVGLLFPLLLILLSWPLLRLWSLQRNQPLRMIDVHLITISLVAVVMLVTFALFDFRFYRDLRGEFDARLELLSAEIETHLRKEIVEAAKQLRQLSSGADITDTQMSYPYFDRAMLLNSAGCSNRHWVPNSESQQWKLVSNAGLQVSKDCFGDREYFRNAAHGVLWNVPDPASSASYQVAVSVVASRFSGNPSW